MKLKRKKRTKKTEIVQDMEGRTFSKVHSVYPYACTNCGNKQSELYYTYINGKWIKYCSTCFTNMK
jgi:predicted restriction endonuclease